MMGDIYKCYMQIDSPLTFSYSTFGPFAQRPAELFLIDSGTATTNQSQIKFIDWLSALVRTSMLIFSNKTNARVWASHLGANYDHDN